MKISYNWKTVFVDKLKFYRLKHDFFKKISLEFFYSSQVFYIVP